MTRQDRLEVLYTAVGEWLLAPWSQKDFLIDDIIAAYDDVKENADHHDIGGEG